MNTGKLWKSIGYRNENMGVEFHTKSFICWNKKDPKSAETRIKSMHSPWDLYYIQIEREPKCWCMVLLVHCNCFVCFLSDCGSCMYSKYCDIEIDTRNLNNVHVLINVPCPNLVVTPYSIFGPFSLVIFFFSVLFGCLSSSLFVS